MADRFWREPCGAWLDLATGVRQWRDVPEPLTGPTDRATTQGIEIVLRRMRALAGEPSARGVRHITQPLPAGSVAAGVSAIARSIRELGFVTVRAGLIVPATLRDVLVHRHLAIALWRDEERLAAVSWVRLANTVSARLHVVLELCPSPPSPRPSRHVQTERGGTRRAFVHVAPSESRSDGHEPRGVMSAGAAEDDDRGEMSSLKTLGDIDAQVDRWVADCQFERVLAYEHTRLTVATLLGRQVSDVVLRACAWARFWTAQFLDAARLARMMARPDAVVIAASAWMRGDAVASRRQSVRGRCRGATTTSEIRATRELREGLDSGENAESGVRTEVRENGEPIAVVLHALAFLSGPPTARATSSVAAWSQRLWRWPPDDGAWPFIQILAAAVDRLRGISPVTIAARLETSRTSSTSRLATLTIGWMTSGLGHRGGGQAVRQEVLACGALALTSVRMESVAMMTMGAVGELVEVLGEADEEAAALGAGLRWLGRHGGVKRAAMVGAVDYRLLAGDRGLVPLARDSAASTGTSVRDAHVATRSDRPASPPVVVRAPVRYGGSVVGMVVAVPADDDPVCAERAATTLAALSGPFVRARLDMLDLSVGRAEIAPEILGRSPAMASLRESIGRAAATPFPVLIEGESGTGKELVARAIHRLSPRRDRRMAAVNCAALSDDLLEAELFGHARGAFTGAVAPRPGLFEDAHQSTLFLDEIGELSPRAQAKVLRALQEREIRRVGENASRPVDVRVVAATNRTLADAVVRGEFREDLLFRLAVVRIRLPPLRDRLEDVVLLAHACWRDVTLATRKHAVLGADAVARLCQHQWPGNVRELQNAMSALAVLAPVRGRVTARHVDQVLTRVAPRPSVTSLDRAKLACEQRVIADALVQSRGRRTEAARALGLTRQGLSKALRRLGLDHPADAKGVA